MIYGMEDWTDYDGDGTDTYGGALRPEAHNLPFLELRVKRLEDLLAHAEETRLGRHSVIGTAVIDRLLATARETVAAGALAAAEEARVLGALEVSA